jgi:putative oxidoreductase
MAQCIEQHPQWVIYTVLQDLTCFFQNPLFLKLHVSLTFELINNSTIKHQFMKINQDVAAFSLRVALSTGFLSAVASRLDFWGEYSSGWDNFVDYTAQVNSFIPKGAAPIIAVISTIIELALGALLFIGYRTSYAAIAAAILTLMFALAMTISSGVKEPLDYSVFAFSAGAFLLATMSRYKWSIDQLLTK